MLRTSITSKCGESTLFITQVNRSKLSRAKTTRRSLFGHMAPVTPVKIAATVSLIAASLPTYIYICIYTWTVALCVVWIGTYMWIWGLTPGWSQFGSNRSTSLAPFDPVFSHVASATVASAAVASAAVAPFTDRASCVAPDVDILSVLGSLVLKLRIMNLVAPMTFFKC